MKIVKLPVLFLPFCLLACSLGGVPMHTPMQPAERPSAPDLQKALVYVSQENGNSISVFQRSGKRIGAITKGVSYPQGLFADASGTLYVANRGGNNVLEFKPGSVSPFKVLSDGKKQPEGVTLCPDGDVYVANILGSHGGGGDISVYANGSTHATGTLTYTSGFFSFLACDAQGNLFGTMVLGTTGTVIEFPGAQQNGAKQLPIFWGGNPAGIAIDAAGNLLVANQGEGVEEFTEAGYPTGLQIATTGLNEIVLSPNGMLLLGSTPKGAVQYTFPGGMLNHTYRTAHGTAIGATFDP